jgi:SAM-dependent methyltransferase
MTIEARSHQRDMNEKKNAKLATHTCPVCRFATATVFWEMSDLPVVCNVLCDTREAALAVPRGDIRLAVCPECAFIWNVSFAPDLMNYHAAYENTLRHSPTFQGYADRLVQRLVDTYDLHGKTVLEIACGDGDFLRQLCAAGGNRGVGFDPTTSVSPSAEANGSVRIIHDYYGEKYADYHADLICCRHALEHIPDPLSFLRSVRASIGERNTAVFFEVPNALYTIRDMGIWDILYEHCSYFSAASFARSFGRAGFRVNGVEESYGGQFLTLDGRPAAGDSAGFDAADRPDVGQVEAVVALAGTFCGRFQAKIDDWCARLANALQGGGKVAVWGAGTKGVMFLNMMAGGGANATQFVAVDINPKKHGKFVAGAGVAIQSPASLAAVGVRCVVVMNPMYREEILAQVAKMGVQADVIAV